MQVGTAADDPATTPGPLLWAVVSDSRLWTAAALRHNAGCPTILTPAASDLTPTTPILTTDVCVDVSTTTAVTALEPATTTPVGGTHLVHQRARHAAPLGAAHLVDQRALHTPPLLRGGARIEDQRAPQVARRGAAPHDDLRAPHADPLTGVPREDRPARLTTQGVGRRGHRSTTTGAGTARGRRHPHPPTRTGTQALLRRGQPAGKTPPATGPPRGGRRPTRCFTLRRSGAATHPASQTAGKRTSGR